MAGLADTRVHPVEQRSDDIAPAPRLEIVIPESINKYREPAAPVKPESKGWSLADLKPPAMGTSMSTELGTSDPNDAGFSAAINAPAPAQSVLQDRAMPAPDRLAQTGGAPLTPEAVKEATRTMAGMTPEQRRGAEALPGAYGTLAKAINRQIELRQGSAVDTALGGSTIEGRAKFYTDQGLDGEAAATMASRDIQAGAPARNLAKAAPLPDAGSEAVAEGRAEGNALQKYSVGTRGIVSGVEGLKQGGLGVAAAALRLAGDHETAAELEQSAFKSKAKTDAMNELTAMRRRAQEAGTIASGPGIMDATYLEDMATGGVASAAQNIPGMAAGAATTLATKNPALGANVAMGLMTTQAFGSSFIDGRQRGYTPGRAAAYAGAMSAFEYVGERYGLIPAAMNAFRAKAKDMPLAEIPAFMERFIASAEQKGLFSKSAGGLVREQLGEQVGEQITGAGQYLIEGSALGQDKPMSVRDFISNAVDTSVQTLIATGMLQTGGRAIRGLVPGGQGQEAPSAPALGADQSTRSAGGFPQGSGTVAPNSGTEQPISGPNPQESGTNQPVGVSNVAPAAMNSVAQREALPASELLGSVEPDTPARQDLEEAAHTAATSPINDTPEPTDAQKKAGNYQKGHIKLHGLEIAIENPRGSERSGTGPDGVAWSNTLDSHYGYFNRTKGNDGDQVDTFIGPNPDSQKVYVVDQTNQDGSFDEHKVLLGFDSQEQADRGYHANYHEGWTGRGAITEMPLDEFKAWVKDGKKTQPLGDITTAQATPTDPGAAPDTAAAEMQPNTGDSAVQTGAAQQSDNALDATESIASEASKTDAPTYFGKNNAPISEGGKPFKTNKAATDARKLQPHLRVVAVDGGFALTEKTQKQIAAQEKAAKRLRTAGASPAGEPIPAHAFIADSGGLQAAAMSDAGFDRNVKVRTKWLFGATGKGLTVEEATAKLTEAGYLRPGASHSEALDVIRKSITNPQYNAEGWERIAQAETEQRMQEAQDLQEEGVQEAADHVTELSDDELAFIDDLDADIPDIFATGEVMTEQDADRAFGVLPYEDTETLSTNDAGPNQGSEVAGQTETGRAPPSGRPRNSETVRATRTEPEVNQTPAPAGVSVSEADTGLTAPTRAEVLAQQQAKEDAEKARVKADKAAEAKAKREADQKDIDARQQASADNFQLGQDMNDALSGQTDIFSASFSEGKPEVKPVAQTKPAQTATNLGADKDAQAKAAAQKRATDALAGIANLLSKNTRSNITPEEEKQLMPLLTELLSAAFDLGHLQFKAAARWALDQIRGIAGDTVADMISLDHLQGAYIGMAGGKQGADTKRAVIDVESKAEIESFEPKADNPTQETQDVPSTTPSLERDSPVAGIEPAVGDTVSADQLRGADEGTGQGGEAAGSQGRGRQDNPGLSADGPTVVGVGGDQQFPGGVRGAEPTQFTAGVDDSERSGDSGITGVPPESIPASTVSQTANPGSAAAAQRAADSVKFAPGLENVRATLPYLLPGQQEDVHKAETTFAKPTGYGMLFTNGTGTGKTFSGLGVAKRFQRQGKTNILIVVPDDKIASDWIDSGRALGLDITKLKDTTDAGKGIVITSYANLGANDALARRQWDLVLPDEAHSLMQDKDGTVTTYLHNLRAITYHPSCAHTRHSMLNRSDIEKASMLEGEIAELEKVAQNPNAPAAERMVAKDKADGLTEDVARLRKKLAAALESTKADVKAKQGAGRTRLLALSATPFAYEKTIDWANGYLFDYNDGRQSEEGTFRGYNEGSNREQFFMQHLGYQMRYNKLTAPSDPKLDRGVLQRQFNGMLKKAGTLSGRMLDVNHDYDRRFISVESAVGNQIDEALDWLSENSRGKGTEAMRAVNDHIAKTFDYLSRRYLLEAIKATESVPIVKQHLALGRKVVVFHDYKKGGGFNPFNIQAESIQTGDGMRPGDVRAAVTQFRSKFKSLVEMPFSQMESPIETYKKAFPDVLLVNGDEKKADLLARYKKFQDDATGPTVMLVQSAKNKGWSGHDTTGKYQRVLLNLGQPTQPTLSIQQEGRVYRTGQASDAIFRYMNTGTNWERWAFATTIATRASTAENLGMGELSRALKDSYISAFEESDAYPPGHEGEGTGGKARDKASNEAITEWDRAKSFYRATQKKNAKTKAQEGTDYFATPEPVGLKMVEWLDARGGESTMEPSGGHGAIARWLPENTNRTVIEPSLNLRSRMAMVLTGDNVKVVDSTFEEYSVVNKYDGIAMNPPFGSGGKTAIDHLAKAATHLRNGGRVVALIPTGPAADKKFDKWFYEKSERPVKPLMTHPTLGEIYRGDTITFDAFGSKTDMVVQELDTPSTNGATYARPKGANMSQAINLVAAKSVKATGARTEEYSPAANLHLVADIKLPQVTFERAGTSVATRIVVIEKQTDYAKAPNTGSTQNRDLSSIDNINDLFDRLENMQLPGRVNVQAAEEVAPPAPVAKPVKAAPAATVPQGDNKLITITTKAGKELRGVIRPDLSIAQAKAIDPYTWVPNIDGKKAAGPFIREKYLKADDFDAPVNARGAEDELLTDYDRAEALQKQEAEEAARAAEAASKTAKAPAGRPVTADQVDMFNEQGSLFARGAAIDRMTVAQTQDVVDALTANWDNAPRVRVVASAADLPVDAPSDARGLYHRSTVWIVADAHRGPEQVARTYAHEAIAHHGLREILGRDDWHKLMHQIQLAIAMGNKPIREISDYIRKTYVDEEGRFELNANLEADEITARVVELAIDPATGHFRPGFGFVKEAYAKLAQWLRDVVGLKIPFTMAELHGMLVSAQQNLKTGTRTQGGGQTVVVAAAREGDALARRPASEVGPVSRDPAKTPLYEALRQLARFDDAFQLERSTAKDLSTIATEMQAGQRLGDAQFVADKGTALHQGNRKKVITLRMQSEDGSGAKLLDIFEYDTPRPFVVIGNSELGQQVGGAKAYQIAFAWAHNNGKTMRPDPAGLTVINRLRRTEAMISSALRYGTTEHLEPHHDQYIALTRRALTTQTEAEDTHYSGNPDLYDELTALKGRLWTPGNEPGNIASNVQHLIEASAQLAVIREPKIRAFEVVDGKLRKRGVAGDISVSDHPLNELSGEASIAGVVLQPGRSGVGSSTLKRYAVSASVGREIQRRNSGAVGSNTQDSGVVGTGQTALQAIRATVGQLDSSAYPQELSRVLYARGAPTGKLRPSTAPIDTLLRVFGGSLAARITSPTYAWLARTLDAITPEGLKAGFVSDYGLREEYLDRKQSMKTAQRQHARQLGDVIDGLQQLDRQQSRVAYFWMQEKPDTDAETALTDQLPEGSRATLEALKARIDDLGQEAVRLGLISADTIERNRMAYLHRSYKRYETEDGSKVKAARSKAIKILGDQFKGRGLRDDVAMDRIAATDWYKRKTQQGKADVSLNGKMFQRLERRDTPDKLTPDMHGSRTDKLGKLREVMYWPADEAIPRHLADWRNDGRWEARFFDKSGKVGMWRDFTLEERTAMGEIQEVRYGVAKTIMQMSRDVETARFLDWIAKQESKADESLLPQDANPLESASMNLLVTYGKNDWVQVPNSAIPGTAGLKRYGNLAGRWVPGPVWNDLRQISSVSDQDVISRVYGPMLRAWKVSKTALSPATHTNNVMANFVMADAHDIQAKHMLAAMRVYSSHKTNPVTKALLEAFQDNGGDAGMFNAEEIKNEIFEPLLQQLEDNLKAEGNSPTALMMASHVFTLLRAGEFRQAFAMMGETRTAKVAGVPFKRLIKLYGQEDEFFRLAAFIKAREDGLSDQEAGKFARESFLNYEINAPWIAALRKSALPFIAFTYRAAPMMAKIAAERPWKLAKWMMVAGGLNALGYLLSGGDEDKERAFMPDEKSGRIWGIVPKLVRMPWNDAYGQPVFLDIRRWIPVGDVVDTGQSHSAVPIPPPLMPGGPMVMMGEVIGNTSLFTGQDITKATDTLAEKWGKVAGYLWKGAMPNIPGLPGSYSSDSIVNAGRGKTDNFGREQSVGQALSSSVGVKLASYPPDVLMSNEGRKMAAEIGELRRGLRSDARQLGKKGMTQEDFDQRAKDTREKIVERSGEFDKKKKQAAGLADVRR